MRGWYIDSANRPPPPVCISLDTLTAERADLYTHVQTPGQPISIDVASFPVDYNIPGEEDIDEAVMRMRLNCAGSPSVMRAKHLKMWLRTARQEEEPNPGNWEKVVAIIQAAFRGEEMVASCDLQMVVIIPKGGGTDFIGIDLVEILRKAISGIINRWISYSIQFRDALHGFRAGRGTETTTL